MSKVYWDTNAFIYLFEDHPAFGPQVVEVREKMRATHDELLTSYLTLAEVQIKPLRENQIDLARSYARSIVNNASLVTFGIEAAEAYTVFRRRTNIHGPDALQLACAAASGAQFFLTFDKQLLRIRVPEYEMFVVTPSTIPL